MEESIKKNNTETLRPLKNKNQALNLEPTTLKDSRVKTNKNNNKLHHINNNNAELITRNPASVKRLIHIN